MNGLAAIRGSTVGLVSDFLLELAKEVYDCGTPADFLVLDNASRSVVSLLATWSLSL